MEYFFEFDKNIKILYLYFQLLIISYPRIFRVLIRVNPLLCQKRCMGSEYIQNIENY